MQNPSSIKDNRRRSVCVFCGSSPGKDPRYAAAANELGTMLATEGFSLVFGGGNIGLMGELARAVRAGNAPVLGILPDFLKHLEPPMTSREEVVITQDLQSRKRLMLDKADAFVVLPGGLGTMDEYFEVISSAQLHTLPKPILLLNTAGFFDPLIALIQHIVREGFAQEAIFRLQHIVVSPSEAVTALKDLLPTA